MALRFVSDVWRRGTGPEEEQVQVIRVLDLLMAQLRHVYPDPPFVPRTKPGPTYFFRCTPSSLAFCTTYAPRGLRSGPVLVEYKVEGQSLFYRQTKCLSPVSLEEVEELFTKVEPTELVRGEFLFECPSEFEDLPKDLRVNVKVSGQEFQFRLPVLPW